MILTSVYYLNISETDQTEAENNYLKSEICYYALQGIKSDYHYHLQLNITIDGERIVIPANIGFEKNENNETLFFRDRNLLSMFLNFTCQKLFVYISSLNKSTKKFSLSKTALDRHSNI